MTRHDIAFLQFQQEYPSVSIIVHLTPKMPDRQANITKAKDALRTAKDRLLKEVSASEAEAIIKQAYAIVEAFDFAQTNARSMAIFVNKHIARVYLLPIALPDRIEIGSTFEIRDIIAALHNMPRYWVLLLSEKPTRLFQGFGQELVEIIEPARDALGHDKDGFPYAYIPPDMQKVQDMMHNKADRDLPHFDGHKEKFFERVFKLFERFYKIDPLPLFIISTEKNQHLFDLASHHAFIAGWIHGDYCKRLVHDIAPIVWPAVKKYLDDECKKKIDYFKEQAMGSRKHAYGIKAVWAAAQEGKVHELLVERDLKVFGIMDPQDPANIMITEKESGQACDLVNELIQVVMSKGDGIVVFCPHDSLKEYEHVAAVLRY